MGMRAMMELREFLCQELDEKVNDIKQRGGMSSGDLDVTNQIVLTMEKIDRIEEIEQNLGGYSMNSYGNNNMNGNSSYRNGSAYNNMSSRGSYSMQSDSYRRGRNMNNGRYMSRDDGKQRTMEELEWLMNQPNLNEDQKSTLQQAMQELQNI